MSASSQSDEVLAERLANLNSRNAALIAVAKVHGSGATVSPPVLEGIAKIIPEPETVENVRDFSSLLADLCADTFIAPLVEMVSADPECHQNHTLSYMYALGSILEESESASQHPDRLFSPGFIAQLGNWLLHRGGGELSWKAAIVLQNIRVPQSYEFMRQGAADRSLFHQARYYCLKGLVNGRGAQELPFLRSLADDPEPIFRENILDAIRWLGTQCEPSAGGGG